MEHNVSINEGTQRVHTTKVLDYSTNATRRLFGRPPYDQKQADMNIGPLIFLFDTYTNYLIWETGYQMHRKQDLLEGMPPNV
jgi:hypothetical protein